MGSFALRAQDDESEVGSGPVLSEANGMMIFYLVILSVAKNLLMGA